MKISKSDKTAKTGSISLGQWHILDFGSRFHFNCTKAKSQSITSKKDNYQPAQDLNKLKLLKIKLQLG